MQVGDATALLILRIAAGGVAADTALLTTTGGAVTPTTLLPADDLTALARLGPSQPAVGAGLAPGVAGRLGVGDFVGFGP